jgi:hypothetical protein
MCVQARCLRLLSRPPFLLMTPSIISVNILKSFELGKTR